MIALLDWDTSFFGYKVGVLHLENQEKLTELLNAESDFKLVYIFSKEKLNIPHSENYSAKWVDTKIVLKKPSHKTIEALTDAEIVPYFGKDDEAIHALALESGIYSRFNIDTNFTNNEFEKLYHEWIKKSLDKTLSEIVYIAYVNNNVAGFITVGRKNHRADIGLIAVNKEFRGRNIGLSLIEKASQYAFLEGFEEIQVITQGENIPAMKLYSKSGFTIEETTFVYHAWRNE
jgi:dTDP-4-amino-4,6-dideoxy-D-galactose acyltransferase